MWQFLPFKGSSDVPTESGAKSGQQSVRLLLWTRDWQIAITIQHLTASLARGLAILPDLPLQTESWKLAPRHIGPYEIERIINRSVVNLKPPLSLKVHPSFHVSLFNCDSVMVFYICVCSLSFCSLFLADHVCGRGCGWLVAVDEGHLHLYSAHQSDNNSLVLLHYSVSVILSHLVIQCASLLYQP